MSDFPFFDIALVSFVIHVISALIATFAEAALNSRWTQGLNGINATSRLFTAPRRDVRFPVSWALMLVARGAIVIAAISAAVGLIAR